MHVNEIRPTFHCFDDAIALLGEMVREDKPARLVHAICVADDGHKYAHAWVEEGGLAWETGLANGWKRMSYAVQQFDYYKTRRVERTWVYTVRDMLAENLTHGTHGPWVPELRALCSSEHRIVGRVQATGPTQE